RRKARTPPATATPTWPASSATPPRPPPRPIPSSATATGASPAAAAHAKPTSPSLSDPETRYADLGADFYARRTDPDRRRRAHVRQLEALGYTVILQRAACPAPLKPDPEPPTPPPP